MSDSKQQQLLEEESNAIIEVLDRSQEHDYLEEEKLPDKTYDPNGKTRAQINKKLRKKAEKQAKKDLKASNKTSKHSTNKSVAKNWGYLGIAAGFLTGCQTFLYGIIISDAITTTYALFFANFGSYLIFYFLYHLKTAIKAKIKYGSYWSKDRSAYIYVTKPNEEQPLKENKGIRLMLVVDDSSLGINRFNLFGVFIRGLISALCTLVRIACFYTEAMSNENYTRVSNILIMEPALIGLCFYVAFQEKLKTTYLAGVLLISASAIVRGISIYSSDSTTITGSISGTVPVILAILQVFLDTFVCLMLRYMTKHTDMRAQQIIADGFFWEGIFFMGIFCYLGFPYQQSIYWMVVALSMMGVTSVFLVNMIIAFGKAAPAVALFDSSFLFTIGFEVIYLSMSPSAMQDIAFLMGLTGVVLIFARSKFKKGA